MFLVSGKLTNCQKAWMSQGLQLVHGNLDENQVSISCKWVFYVLSSGLNMKHAG